MPTAKPEVHLNREIAVTDRLGRPPNPVKLPLVGYHFGPYSKRPQPSVIPLAAFRKPSPEPSPKPSPKPAPVETPDVDGQERRLSKEEELGFFTVLQGLLKSAAPP